MTLNKLYILQCFGHFFEGVGLVVTFMLYSPHFSEATSSHNFNFLKLPHKMISRFHPINFSSMAILLLIDDRVERHSRRGHSTINFGAALAVMFGFVVVIFVVGGVFFGFAVWFGSERTADLVVAVSGTVDYEVHLMCDD